MSTLSRDYEYGRIVSVDVITLGDNLAADAALSATTITVEDAADFDEGGGSLLLNDVVYVYTACDDDTGIITLSTTLVAAAVEGDDVSVYDPLYLSVSTDKVAQVAVVGDDGAVDTLECAISDGLVDRLSEGVRADNGEFVKLELEGGEWVVVGWPGSASQAANVDPDLGGETKFWNDSTSVITAGGDQEITLTYLPISQSEHVYWNGIYQAAPEWTRAGQVITLPDPDGVFEADDRISVEYAYLDGAVIITPDVPNETESVIYGDGTIFKPAKDDARWVATSDGWGDWRQKVRFSVLSQPSVEWRGYVVIKHTPTWVSFNSGYDLTTYGGTNYHWANTLTFGADPSLGIVTSEIDVVVSIGRHTPVEAQGTPEWEVVGAGVYKAYAPPYSYDDVPQDLVGAAQALARFGVTSAALSNAYWGAKVADIPTDTTDEPVGAL